MNKRNIICFILVFSIFLFLPKITHADCGIAGREVGEQDYSNVDCYNNEDFYRTADPNKFDWNKVDFDGKEIYKIEGFYGRLSSLDDKSKDFYYKKINYREADLSLLEHQYVDINKFGSDVIPDKILNFKTSKEDVSSIMIIEEKSEEEDFHRNENDKLGCDDCKLEFIKNKDSSYTIKTDKGSEVTITKYPSGTMFELKPDGTISAKYPKDIKSIEVPAQDNVLVNIEKGQSIKDVPKEINIEGSVLSIKGEKYLSDSYYAKINNVEIFPGDKIKLFFDGNEHPEFSGDFLSLNPYKQSFIIKTNSQYRTTVNFYKDNPFLDVEDGDNLNINLEKSKMNVINRASRGLIPEVNLYYLDRSSNINFRNNDMDFSFSYDKLKYKINTGIESGSVPMVVNLFYENGQRVFGNGKYDTKLVISNFNEFAFLKLSQEQGYSDLLEDGLPNRIVSTKIKYNSQIPYFTAIKGTVIYPYIKQPDLDYALYNAPEGNPIDIYTKPKNIIAIKKVIDDIESLHPEVRSTIKEVQVLDYDSFSNICGNAGACATYDNKIIFLKSTVSNIGTFEHEAAHSRTFNLINEEEKIYQKNEDQIKKLYIKVEGKTADEWWTDFDKLSDEKIQKLREINEILKNTKDESTISNYENKKREIVSGYDKQLDDIYSKIVKTQTPPINELFNDLPPNLQEEYKKSPIFRWKLVVGDLYGKNLGGKDVGGKTGEAAYLSSAWSDGSYEPRYGFVSAYGANNIHEDISTFTEYVKTEDYEFFKPLLDPNSPNYDKKYKEKLDILLSAGYISQKDYNKVTKVSKK